MQCGLLIVSILLGQLKTVIAFLGNGVSMSNVSFHPKYTCIWIFLINMYLFNPFNICRAPDYLATSLLFCVVLPPLGFLSLWLALRVRKANVRGLYCDAWRYSGLALLSTELCLLCVLLILTISCVTLNVTVSGFIVVLEIKMLAN